MKILLLGEYSNVHATLADGLRELGHKVVLVSNGDFWKNYPRDIDVSRPQGRFAGVRLWLRIFRLLPKLRGFDVVQVINPMFFELRAERIFPIYRYLKKHNKRLVLGAFGMDYYWVHTNTTTMPLRYSDFNIGKILRHNADAKKEKADWLGTAKEQLNKLIAKECDAIVAGLYEYWACYHPIFPHKTTFIPFPIRTDEAPDTSFTPPLKLFIGISKGRSEYKGTDIMLPAAEEVCRKYPDKVVLRKVEGVPFSEYVQLMRGSDAIIDQLYSYTPSMNPLEAMSHGIICIGGGEPENYEVLNEQELRPIVNVQPTYESVRERVAWLANHPEEIAGLKQQSVEYIRRHHDHIKVAKRYESLYASLLCQPKGTWPHQF